MGTSGGPALVYTSGGGSVYSTPLTTPVVQRPVTYSAGPVYPTGVQTPVVYSTGVQTPVVYSTGLQRPVVYSAGVASTHTITNYHNPTHYTAVSNGAVGPKYIAKNGPVAHVVKREAEAEAEADPWYTTYSGMIPSYPTSVYPRYPVYPAVNSVPTVNTVVPTINTVLPTVNRIVPTINGFIPTVNTINTVNTLRNLPIADTFEHDTKNPFLIADDFGLGTKKTETDAGDEMMDVVVA